MIDAEMLVTHLTTERLEAGMEHVLRSPVDGGILVKIVRRPDVERREIVEEGALDVGTLVSSETTGRPAAAPARPTAARIRWPRSR